MSTAKQAVPKHTSIVQAKKLLAESNVIRQLQNVLQSQRHNYLCLLSKHNG